MHDQLVVDEVERVGLRLVRMLDHFVHYNKQTNTNKMAVGNAAGHRRSVHTRTNDLLSSSLNGGRSYTESHVFVDPGMQKPKVKSKLFTNCKTTQVAHRRQASGEHNLTVRQT